MEANMLATFLSLYCLVPDECLSRTQNLSSMERRADLTDKALALYNCDGLLELASLLRRRNVERQWTCGPCIPSAF